MATEVMQNTGIVYGGRTRTEFIYQDEQCVVFEEEAEDKAAPSHFLVVARKQLPRLSAATLDDEKLLDHLLLTANRIAYERGLRGYHVTVDENHRTDKFICLHVFGRALHHMLWPVGPGSRL